MVKSAAGREYKRQDLVEQGGSAFDCWTCLECGCLVGPLRKHRDAHDAWHAKVGR